MLQPKESLLLVYKGRAWDPQPLVCSWGGQGGAEAALTRDKTSERFAACGPLKHPGPLRGLPTSLHNELAEKTES